MATLRTPFPLLTREDSPELLDLGAGTLHDVRENLTEMWRINRYLGGFRALAQHLYPRLAALHDPVVVADLGSGAGEMLLRIAKWADGHGLAVRLVALDWAARNLSVAQERCGNSPHVRLLQADANHLPFARGGVDYVISSLFLHHFSPDEVINLLQAAYERAQWGVIMSDLVRGWLPLAAFKVAQPVFARHYLTRHDGALSVRRAYTPDELREMAEAAGLLGARVYTHWPWRMTLVVDR